MDEIDRSREPLHLVEQLGNVRIVLDDLRDPEDREPLTVRIIFREKESFPLPHQSNSQVRVIHADELAEIEDASSAREESGEELMTFGESVTLLIAIGVLLYLVYALLWPDRF